MLAAMLCTIIASMLLHAATALQLPAFISSDMVLQRSPQRARLWGRSSCQTVRVAHSQAGHLLSEPRNVTVGADKLWQVELDPQPAGVGHSISLEDCDGQVSLENVLFGDVFFCSGQSNMEFAIHQDHDREQTIAESTQYPHLRMFSAVRSHAAEPQFDIAARTKQQAWVRSEPQSFGDKDFSFPSALCYYNARQLYNFFDGELPIGIVGSYFGGTRVESWSSSDALNDQTCGGIGQLSEPVFGYRPTRSYMGTTSYEHSETLQEDVPNKTLYNAMFSPFLPMRFAAIYWYQGEANAHHADDYACRFPAMIADWRRKLELPDVPFFFTLLAGYWDAHFVSLRAAQMHALGLPRTALASAIDLGDMHDIHPRFKKELGRRMSLATLQVLYGEKVDSLGPRPATAELNQGTHELEIEFGPHALTFLRASGSKGCNKCCDESPFEVLTSSSAWVRAPFHIKGSKVALAWPAADPPKAVRYASEAFPQCTLYGDLGGLASGLPALPFVHALE